MIKDQERRKKKLNDELVFPCKILPALLGMLAYFAMQNICSNNLIVEE